VQVGTKKTWFTKGNDQIFTGYLNKIEARLVSCKLWTALDLLKASARGVRANGYLTDWAWLKIQTSHRCDDAD